MLVLLYGPDTFRSRQYLKEMIEEFKAKRDPSGLNVACFDAEKVEPGEILEALTASPFLAEKRLVAVERLSARKQKDLADCLLAMVKDKKIPSTTVAIFWEGEIKKNSHPLFDVLAKQDFSRKFDLLAGEKLGQWIKQELKQRNFKIEKSALAALVSYPWNDLWQLNNELEKITAYLSQKDEKEIVLKDLSPFLANPADENIFHFIDALVGRRPKEAIKLLHDQWDSGETEFRLFNFLIGQISNLLIIKDYFTLNPGVNSYQAAQVLGLHPFVVKKSLAVLPGFSFERLKEIHRQLLEIDIQAKTGGGELKNLMEMLVAKICL